MAPRRLLLGILLGLYLIGLGTLLGMLVERVHFDRQRAALLARYDHALRDGNALRMTVEIQGSGARRPSAP